MTRHITPTYLPLETEQYRKSGQWSGRSFAGYLRGLASSRPNDVGVVDRSGRYTWAQIDAWAEALAGFFVELGVTPGEAVTWQLPNWIEAFVINQALVRIGAVSNPVIPIYRDRELTYILREADSPVYVVPASFRGFDYLGMACNMRDTLPSLRHVVAVGEPGVDWALPLPGFEAARTNAPAKERPLFAGDHPLLLMYTSGTTANPKGAIHSHNTLIHDLEFKVGWYRYTPEDVMFTSMPVTHATGYLFGLMQPLTVGMRLVLQDVWDVDRAVQTIIAEGCTFTGGPATFMQDMLIAIRKRGVPPGGLPLRMAICGGSDVPPQLVEEVMAQGIASGRVYGSTEFPHFSGIDLDRSSQEQRANTDGSLIMGEGRLVDDNDVDVAPGEPGELLLKGPCRFLGYLDAERNEESFTKDGWFHTGDIVMMRPDGCYVVKGRKKDIINRGGEKISAKEVEDVLYKHPRVADVAIVAMPDERMSEKACAYVVPRDPARPPSLADLTAFLDGERMAKPKFPERLEIISEMPRTPTGKIQKHLLRQDIRQKLGSANPTALPSAAG